MELSGMFTGGVFPDSEFAEDPLFSIWTPPPLLTPPPPPPLSLEEPSLPSQPTSEPRPKEEEEEREEEDKENDGDDAEMGDAKFADVHYAKFQDIVSMPTPMCESMYTFILTPVVYMQVDVKLSICVNGAAIGDVGAALGVNLNAHAGVLLKIVDMFLDKYCRSSFGPMGVMDKDAEVPATVASSSWSDSVHQTFLPEKKDFAMMQLRRLDPNTNELARIFCANQSGYISSKSITSYAIGCKKDEAPHARTRRAMCVAGSAIQEIAYAMSEMVYESSVEILNGELPGHMYRDGFMSTEGMASFGAFENNCRALVAAVVTKPPMLWRVPVYKLVWAEIARYYKDVHSARAGI